MAAAAERALGTYQAGRGIGMATGAGDLAPMGRMHRFPVRAGFRRVTQGTRFDLGRYGMITKLAQGQHAGPVGGGTAAVMTLNTGLLLGLVLIVEGLPYVAAPEAMQNWLRKLSEISPSQLRAVGLVAMASGLIICFVVQRTTLFQ